MERDIDMGQTIEDAAKEYSSQFLWGEDDKIASLICENDLKRGFKAGAEWQAKQSPWINAKDKLPDDEDLVITGCWCTDYFKYLQQGWYCRECNEWYDTNGDKICVTHWMPILDLRNSINRAYYEGL